MQNSHVQSMLRVYDAIFPESYHELALLRERSRCEASITSRTNQTGHVTVSGIVLHEGTIALVFHNALEKFIQPGGHLESDASFHEGAKREVEEETGLGVTLQPWHEAHACVPIHIDIHTIPYNKKKQEPEHLHYDFVYLFSAVDQNVTLQEIEVSDLRWLPLTTYFDEKLLDAVTKKIIDLE